MTEKCLCAFTLPPHLRDTSKSRSRSQRHALAEHLTFRTQKLHLFLLTLKTSLEKPETPSQRPQKQSREGNAHLPYWRPLTTSSPSIPQDATPAPPLALDGVTTVETPQPTGRTNPEVSPNIPVCPRTRNLRPVFCEPRAPE